jgi:hypothetical protein
MGVPSQAWNLTSDRARVWSTRRIPAERSQSAPYIFQEDFTSTCKRILIYGKRLRHRAFCSKYGFFCGASRLSMLVEFNFHRSKAIALGVDGFWGRSKSEQFCGSSRSLSLRREFQRNSPMCGACPDYYTETLRSPCILRETGGPREGNVTGGTQSCEVTVPGTRSAHHNSQFFRSFYPNVRLSGNAETIR